MANTASARKRNRQTKRRTERNQARKSRMRTFVKKVEVAIASGKQGRDSSQHGRAQVVSAVRADQGVAGRLITVAAPADRGSHVVDNQWHPGSFVTGTVNAGCVIYLYFMHPQYYPQALAILLLSTFHRFSKMDFHCYCLWT